MHDTALPVQWRECVEQFFGSIPKLDVFVVACGWLKSYEEYTFMVDDEYESERLNRPGDDFFDEMDIDPVVLEEFELERLNRLGHIEQSFFDVMDSDVVME